MLVSALITEVRTDYLDDTLGVDTNDALVSEASLLRFTDEAEEQSCRRMDLLYDETTASVCAITIADGTKAYAIDSRITKLERVSWNGIDLPKKHESEYSGTSWRETEGEPTSYYVKQRSIYLHPTPDADAVSEDNALALAVFRTPETSITADTDTPEIPAEFHRDLINWVLYRVYNLRDEDLFDPAKASYYLSAFTNSFGPEVPADVRQHQFESPRTQVLRPKTGYQFTNQSEADPDFSSTGWDNAS